MTDKAQLTAVTIALPANLLLPQLGQGRIEIPLADLFALLPKDVVQDQLPPTCASQKIVLPLAEVIAAIPPDALAPQHEAMIAIDTPEFNSLPKVFDDSVIPKPGLAEPVCAAATEEVTEAPAASEPVPVAPPAHPALVSDVPEHVMISLRSLVSVMPDDIFACPRAELWRKADFDIPVLLPVQPMLPQLKSARVRLPLATVIEVIPRSLLADPLPEIDDETVPVPLGEIVSQLPPRLFTNGMRDAEPQEVETLQEEFPDPFAEKTPAPAAPVAAQQEEVEVEPQPVDDIEDAIVETDATEDEELVVFAEKEPAALEPPVTSEPLVTPAPVVATEPPPVVETPEPVVVETPEPVAESPAPVEPVSEPEPTPECVANVTGLGENRYLIDLNRCTAEDLQQIEGVGPALARRIIEFRNARGQFASIKELRQIPGIGRKTFQALAGIEPRSLNRLLGVPHDEELSLQEIVRLAGQLPGVEGCMLAMSDGLFLTGQLPDRLDQNTVSVFAPQLFKKVGRYMRELRVGQIRRLTIFTDQQPLSIFRAGDVYLIIVHDVRHFSKALLRRCERISEEIARLCRQRAVV